MSGQSAVHIRVHKQQNGAGQKEGDRSIILKDKIIIVKFLIRQSITITNFSVNFLNDCDRKADKDK